MPKRRWPTASIRAALTRRRPVRRRRASAGGVRGRRHGGGPGLPARAARARARIRPLGPVPSRDGAVTDELAGAAGFEPAHGGTKNRCLTAWLRPNTRVDDGRDASRGRAGPARLGERRRQFKPASVGGGGVARRRASRPPCTLAAVHTGRGVPPVRPRAGWPGSRRDGRDDGGAERDRTADLVIANDALSQLSYGPAPSHRPARAGPAPHPRTEGPDVGARLDRSARGVRNRPG